MCIAWRRPRALRQIVAGLRTAEMMPHHPSARFDSGSRVRHAVRRVRTSGAWVSCAQFRGSATRFGVRTHRGRWGACPHTSHPISAPVEDLPETGGGGWASMRTSLCMARTTRLLSPRSLTRSQVTMLAEVVSSALPSLSERSRRSQRPHPCVDCQADERLVRGPDRCATWAGVRCAILQPAEGLAGARPARQIQ